MQMLHQAFQSFLPISCYPLGDVVLLMCGDKLPCNSYRSDEIRSHLCTCALTILQSGARSSNPE